MTETTQFTKDVIGRYICNTFEEAVEQKQGGEFYDVIILGGGTYGGVLAHHLNSWSGKRVLVVEAGPLLFPEHVQDLPGFNGVLSGSPRPTEDKEGYNEVWGIPWNGNSETSGLAYCLGGKSVFWGGWAPRYLGTEMPEDLWPEGLVSDLNEKYFKDAELLTGVTDPNDFSYGPLHNAIRREVYTTYKGKKFGDEIPLKQLPQPYEPNTQVHSRQDSYIDRHEIKFEPPYAVSTASRPGYYANGKFNSVALIVQAARASAAEDVENKRLTILPQTHVVKLVQEGSRVSEIVTGSGNIRVRPDAQVVLSMSPIETARVALLSFEGNPSYGNFGKNLMTHGMLKTAFKFNREQYPEVTIEDLQMAAQLVRFRHKFKDGTYGHYHVHVMVSGRPEGASPYEAFSELFKKLPDVEFVDYHARFKDKEICVSMMGFSELEPDTESSVSLDWVDTDEFGVKRAYVNQFHTDRDREVLEIMGERMSVLAKVLSRDPNLELNFSEPPASAIHHECGTMRIGTDPAISAVDENLKVHWVDNCYVCDMSAVPTAGSANPMIMGVALARRLGDHLK